MATAWTNESIKAYYQQYGRLPKYEIGDTFNNQTFNGRNWLPQNELPGEKLAGLAERAATTTIGNVMTNATPQQLLYGRDKADTAVAASMKAGADLNEQQARRNQQDAQRGYQLASRDPRVEADKDAATRAAAQFTQRMGQQKNASGGGAAVAASLNVVDPSTALAEHRQRADTQFERGRAAQIAAESAMGAAIQKRMEGEEVNREARDLAGRNLSSSAMARAEYDERKPDARGTTVTTPFVSPPQTPPQPPSNLAPATPNEEQPPTPLPPTTTEPPVTPAATEPEPTPAAPEPIAPPPPTPPEPIPTPVAPEPPLVTPPDQQVAERAAEPESPRSVAPGESKPEDLPQSEPEEETAPPPITERGKWLTMTGLDTNVASDAALLQRLGTEPRWIEPAEIEEINQSMPAGYIKIDAKFGRRYWPGKQGTLEQLKNEISSGQREDVEIPSDARVKNIINAINRRF